MNTLRPVQSIHVSDVHEALRKIVYASEREKAGPLNYAVNYARYGLCIMQASELRVQCLYVLSNIEHWHGPVATEVRTLLKAFTKGIR